jgi:hypothetical protein
MALYTIAYRGRQDRGLLLIINLIHNCNVCLPNEFTNFINKLYNLKKTIEEPWENLTQHKEEYGQRHRN